MTYSKAAASVAVEQTELKAKRKLPVWVIYLLPSLLIFLLFTIYPFVKTFITSFFATSTTGAMTKFVGVQNYIDLFTNANYLQSLGTTFLYTLLHGAPDGNHLPAAGCAFRQQPAWDGSFPHHFFFHHGYLRSSGLCVLEPAVPPHRRAAEPDRYRLWGKPIGWLTDTHYAIFAISAVSIWMNIGFSYLVLMGGIKNIDDSHYESVEIVGGGFFYRLRKVTIPLVSPSPVLRVHHLADQRLSILRPHRYAHFRRPQQHHEPDGI